MKAAPFIRVSVTEILNNSFSIYLSSIRIFFSIFLALNIANAALAKFILGFLPPFNPLSFSPDGSVTQIINYLVSLTPILSITFLLTWILTNLGCGLVVKCTFDILEGRKVDVKSNFMLTLRSLGKILGVSFLTGVLIISGIILLIVPGIIVAVIFSLSIPALICEQLGVFESLKRSKYLTDGVWWKTFLLLIAVIALLAVSYIFAEILVAVADIRQSIAKITIIIMVISFVEPIYPIGMSCLYYILRRQKSAYQLMNREVAYPQRTQDIGVKICYNCGQVLPYDAIYCPNCGLRVAY